MKRDTGRALGSAWPARPLGARGQRLGWADDIRRLRNLPFALFAVGILGYGAVYAWYMLDRFDLFNLLRDVSYDDAFYYYQIAYHMAEGRFSTFDGITRTNGYHPLWLFLVTPFYWAFDKTEALFAVKAFEIALVAGGVALVAVAARVARLPWILLFAVLPALFAQRGMLWGLEAALVLFMLGALMLAACLFARDPVRWKWPLAAVAFALPWARLECVAVAVAATAALGFLEWSGRLPGVPAAAPCGTSQSSPGRAGRWSLPGLRFLRVQAAAPLAGAFAGVLVYFAYNGIVFGGVVPVSGAVGAFRSQQVWESEGGYGLAESLEAFTRLEVFDGEILTALEVCVWALLVWWLSRGSRSREDALLLAFAAGVVGLAAGHLAKFAHSVLFMHPTHSFQHWYYVPAYLVEALVVPLRCCVGIYLVRRFLAPRLPRTSDVLRLGAIAAAATVLAAQVNFAAPFRLVDAARDEVKTKNWNVHAYMGTAVMDRLLPEGTLVGSWDGGAVGYFSRLPVMNLDGLANSYGYKEAMEEDSVGTFWRRHGLFHFGNVYADGNPRQQITVLWHKAISIQSEPFHQGATWGPGFDVRVEDGHLVYAKAPCTPDDVAAPFLLHVFPISRDDLPDRRKRFGYENLDFPFKHHGEWRDGACVVRIALPDYGIASLRAGQYIPNVEFVFKAARGSRLRRGGLQFKLHRNDAEWALSQVDGASWFRERIAPHLDPQGDDIGLLVEGRAAQAFAWDCTADANEVAEWSFGGEIEAVTDWTQTAEGLCASALVLPHGHPDPVRVRRAPLAEAVDGLAGGRPPAIRGDTTGAGGFDVYRTEDALIYVKAACERADVETRFFLRIVPAADDFDDDREAVGDYDHDFMLAWHGDWFGEEERGIGPCLAEVPLPDYDIAEIRTGQHSASDFRRIWEGGIASSGRPRAEGA